MVAALILRGETMRNRLVSYNVHAVRPLDDIAAIFGGRHPRLDEIVSQPETYRQPITGTTQTDIKDIAWKIRAASCMANAHCLQREAPVAR